MVSRPDMNPQPGPIKGPTPTPKDDATAPTWNPKPLKWLGMSFDEKETKQLWYTITQSIGQAIQRDKDRAVAALKKLKKSTDPDGDDDS